MNAATRVIQKCGGVPRTASLAETSENWVYRWRLDKDKGGTGGVIPPKAQMKLLEAASRGEVDISPSDFFETTLTKNRKV